MQSAYYTEESERLSARHHMARRRVETEAQRAYAGLESARFAAGVARIVQGVHLVSLHDSGGWKGRTGAKSFRRFLLEGGIEPKAAHQYMTVAKAFVLEHAVSPEAIALVGMRVLVAAAPHLRGDDPAAGVESNVDDIVALVTTLPAAEAHVALTERFGAAGEEETPAERLSRPVHRILNEVDTLTHDQRAELYQRLRATPARTQQSKSAIDIPETTKA
jgi:hypothetical protein